MHRTGVAAILHDLLTEAFMDQHGFRLSDRTFVDLIRAMSAAEARSITSGVVSGEGHARFITPEGEWRCEPEAGDYRVTLPDGRSAVGSTVANALTAAKLIVL